MVSGEKSKLMPQRYTEAAQRCTKRKNIASCFSVALDGSLCYYTIKYRPYGIALFFAMFYIYII
jgi:hypothetical protein